MKTALLLTTPGPLAGAQAACWRLHFVINCMSITLPQMFDMHITRARTRMRARNRIRTWVWNSTCCKTGGLRWNRAGCCHFIPDFSLAKMQAHASSMPVNKIGMRNPYPYMMLHATVSLRCTCADAGLITAWQVYIRGGVYPCMFMNICSCMQGFLIANQSSMIWVTWRITVALLVREVLFIQNIL